MSWVCLYIPILHNVTAWKLHCERSTTLEWPILYVQTKTSNAALTVVNMDKYRETGGQISPVAGAVGGHFPSFCPAEPPENKPQLVKVSQTILSFQLTRSLNGVFTRRSVTELWCHLNDRWIGYESNLGACMSVRGSDLKIPKLCSHSQKKKKQSDETCFVSWIAFGPILSTVWIQSNTLKGGCEWLHVYVALW